MLYNKRAGIVDICFLAEEPSGQSIGLESSLERGWPLQDESDWYW